jgi:hypothetical protein
MSVPIWPSGLPNELLQRGYAQETANTVLRTNMDAGPNKVRRRYTAGIEPIKGNLLLTFAELGLLREFYDVTLQGGSLRFTGRDPITLVDCEFRFTAPVKWSMTSGWVDVSVEFEVLP